MTVEHLLSHRSGIGDYLDEEVEQDPNEYAMSVPARELAATEDYLIVLDALSRKFAAGERFAYCNSGYVLLALIAEHVSAMPFDELVRQRVCKPARMHHTGFLRSDELPGRAAHSDVPAKPLRYALGFWLDGADERVFLEGADAGVSFRSVHDPRCGTTHTVISNTSEGGGSSLVF